MLLEGDYLWEIKKNGVSNINQVISNYKVNSTEYKMIRRAIFEKHPRRRRFF